MGKGRARKAQRNRDDTLRGKSVVKRRLHNQNGSLKKVVPPATTTKNSSSNKNNKKQQKKKNGSSSQPTKPVGKVPFASADNVLLVGEGDFSFALSLVKQYKPTSVIATCFDSEQDLRKKYPGVEETLAQIVEQGRLQTCSGTAGDTPDDDDDDGGGGDSFDGFSPSSIDHQQREQHEDEDEDSNEDSDDSDDLRTSSSTRHKQQPLRRIIHGIDATKLSTTHKNVLRPLGPFTKIVFNFPHVGGLSTDVNRQVRSNQQLLVGFFNSAKSLLTSRSTSTDTFKEDGEEEDKDPIIVPKGQILVTLFEGEPYTLWNIRDLARHCGLQVVESFKFPWSAYHGYRHARTLGAVLTSGGGSSSTTTTTTTRDGDATTTSSSSTPTNPQGKKRKGAWRGEERDARSYVLELKDDGDGDGGDHHQGRRAAASASASASASYNRKKNRRRGENSSDED